MKRAFITGITGQDGSYLAELLLEKRYEVWGMVRRSSSPIRSRIDHLRDQLHLVYGDMTDGCCLMSLVQRIQPDEVYNLAAQSHVRISFDQPAYTASVGGLGVLHLLEAVRSLKKPVRVYQASTSEMFGNANETPQSEQTPFHPCSPYACAKLYAYWQTVNYRKAYDMFVCNGILFNHESIPSDSPVILKKNGWIEIIPICDMFKVHTDEGMLDKYIGYEIWTGDKWTTIIQGHRYHEKRKPMKLIQTVSSCYEATLDHVSFLEDGTEIKTKKIKKGNAVFSCRYPKIENNGKFDDLELARFVGFIVGDGYIGLGGKIRLSGTNSKQLLKIAKPVMEKYLWKYRLVTHGPGQFENCKKDIWHLNIQNDSDFGKWLRKSIYTKRQQKKKVPSWILNAPVETQKAFYDGYYLADGRKAGHERYPNKGYTTNSASLCLGLNFIVHRIFKQAIKTKMEYREGKRYYRTQFRSPVLTNKGRHLRKPLNLVVQTMNTENENGWFYDLTTESKSFCTGPNLFKIHNSPRRAESFVTRKITQAAARIKCGLQDKLELGNLDARRDWGYAKDYVEAMWKMMQEAVPDDFVIATGESHSVREFLDEAFEYLGMDWRKYVDVNPYYFRPSELDFLMGDMSKAKRVLKWEPRVSFEELVRMMVDSDMRLVKEGMA